MSTSKRSHKARSRKKSAPSPVTNTSPGVVGGGASFSGLRATLKARGSMFGRARKRKPKPWAHLPACTRDPAAMLAWHHERAMIALDWLFLYGGSQGPLPEQFNPPLPVCTCNDEVRTGALLV